MNAPSSQTKVLPSTVVMADSLDVTPPETMAKLMVLVGQFLIGTSLGILERMRKDQANPPQPPPQYGQTLSMTEAFIDSLAGVDMSDLCGAGEMSGGAPHKESASQAEAKAQQTEQYDQDQGTQRALQEGMLSGNLVRKSAQLVQKVISASATGAAQLADSAFAEAKDTLEEMTGLSGMTWEEAMPVITKTMMVLAVMIKKMADDPQAREALQSFAIAIGDTGMELVRVIQPEVIRVTNKIGQSMGTVGGIAARRAAMAAVSVFKAGIAMIPGVNVVVFGIMTLLSLITGALRITLQAVGTGEQTTSAFMNSMYSMSQVLEQGSKAVAEATDALLTFATPPSRKAVRQERLAEAREAQSVVDPRAGRVPMAGEPARSGATAGGGGTRKTKRSVHHGRAHTVRNRVRTSIDRFLRAQSL